jgi:GAF domain-containing protein/HAMP domain-containing protein
MKQQSILNRLQTRQMILVIAVMLPVLVGLLLSVTSRAESLLETAAHERLSNNAQALANSMTRWMDMNVRALRQMVSLPTAASPDEATVRPVLAAMAETYPHMYLVSTTDLNGVNVARSDDAEPKDYGDRLWYQNAAKGAALTFQTLVGRTSGEPALVASMPIQDDAGSITGVGMFATDLSDLSEQVKSAQLGETGYAYLVDDQGQVLAHPDPSYSAELRDLSAVEPVAQVLQGYTGPVEFVDAQGTHWMGYTKSLDNGWGLVVQQEASEVWGTLRTFERVSWLGLLLATSATLGLTYWVTRRTLKPVRQLTAAAMAVAQGDLSQKVPLQGGAELEALAQAFNTMTEQVQDLVANLGNLVAERTTELAQRAEATEKNSRQSQRRVAQLEASAGVARSVAALLDTDELLDQVVHLISEAFGNYHTGVFLLDDAGRWAELRAANSPGGKRLLTRGHRLEVGAQGIVGNVTRTGQPHIAHNVGADAIYFDNPELPDTQTEVALPLVARGHIIGALDIQSTDQRAFDDTDVAILSSLADQIAVALDNARLYQVSQSALAQVQAAQRLHTAENWREYGVNAPNYFEYGSRAEVLEQDTATQTAEMALEVGTTVTTTHENGKPGAIVAPIKVRGTVIGALGLESAELGDGQEWSGEDIALIETVADQVAQAMEAARLFDETERRARREQLVTEISDRIRAAPDMETILRTAVREIRRTLGVSHGAIRLGTETHLQPPGSENLAHSRETDGGIREGGDQDE